MSIRRLQYQIDYVHLLSFREQYKDAVAPYFSFDNVEYAIDNEGTLDESIRLVFKTEKMIIFMRKEAMVFLYEGDIEVLKNQNGPVKLFWDLFEKVKSFKNFSKASRQVLIVHAVNLKTEEENTAILANNPYFTINPFGKLDEFACTYEFNNDSIGYKFQFGNYSPKDIKKHGLMPFRTEFNKDLVDGFGIMGRVEAIDIEKSPTFGKFKHFLSKIEGTLSTLDLL